MSIKTLTSPILFFLFSFFYIFTAASLFRIPIFFFSNRITQYKHFEFYVVTRQFDSAFVIVLGALLLGIFLTGRPRIICIILAASALSANLIFSQTPIVGETLALIIYPLVIGIIAINKKRELFKRQAENKVHPSRANIWLNNLRILTSQFSLCLTLLAMYSIAISLLPVIAPDIHFSISSEQSSTDFQDKTISIRDYGFELFSLFSMTSPILMLLLIWCFASKPIMEFLKKLLANNKQPNRIILSQEIPERDGSPIFSMQSKANIIRARHRIIWLSFSIAFSIVMASLPHNLSINPNQTQVGVDTPFYVRWINELDQTNSIPGFFYQAFAIQNHGDRPLSLVLIYGFVKLTSNDSNPILAIEQFPLILAPALVIVVYFLTRELGYKQNHIVPLLASFATAVSYQVLIGIYASFYANWIALIIGYLALGFLFRFLNNPKKVMPLILFSIFVYLLYLSHVYTWAVISVIMIAFLLLSAFFIRKSHYKYSKKTISILLAVIISSASLGLFQAAITGTNIMENELKLVTSTTLIDQKEPAAGDSVPMTFATPWINLERTIYTFLGGLFSNFIVLGLCLYWLAKRSWQEPSTILITLFLSFGAIPFIIGDWQSQARIFYDIPFQVPVALALAWIVQTNNKTLLQSLLPFCMWLIAISIHAVTNFVSS